MKLLKSSLALMVTMIMLVTFVILFALFTLNQYHSLKEHAFNEAMVNLRTILMVSQSRLEKEIRNDDFNSVEREVMALNLLDDVRLSALIDDLGVVRYSSSFVIKDQSAKGQLKQFDESMYRQAKTNNTPIVVTTNSKDTIYGYYPVLIKRSEKSLRADRVGVLFVEWSLFRPYRAIQNDMIQNAVTLCILVGFIMLALIAALQKLVLAPLNNIKNKALRIASGTEALSFNVEGVAELGALSQALNRMNLNLSKTLQDAKASEQRWLFALQGAGDAVQDWNVISDECFFSDQIKLLLGLTGDEPVTWSSWMETIHVNDRDYVQRKIQRHIKGLSEVCRAEYNVELPNGERRTVLLRGKVVEWLGNGDASRFVATHSDITVRRLMEDALRASEEKYRKLFEMAQEGIWLLDSAGNTSLVNEAMANMLGHNTDEMVGSRFMDFVDESKKDVALSALRHDNRNIVTQLDVEFKTRGGRRVYTNLNSAPLFNDDGDSIGVIIGVMDITERKLAEEHIKQQALYDDLTKLPNRRMLNERLSQEQARAIRHKHSGALLFIDLDHFKNVNDSLGHPIGDGLLVSIGERLKTVIRTEDTLARLGGDEFVVLLPELSEEEHKAGAIARSVALKIQDVLSESFDIAGHKLNISCSIGIALYPLDQETIHDIMKHADAAMYRAKEEGRGTVRLFSKVMHEEIEHNLSLQMLLPGALEEEQFMLYFQPQFNHHQQLIGAEVLLRWQEPNLGFVRPDHFIRAAEESGQIVPLGDWVIKKACWQLKQWHDIGLPSSFERLAINISPRQFMLDDFAHRVKAQVEASGMAPALLELEITESMLLTSLDQVVEKMNVLSEMGFYIALDDFGTGYSSLSYLSTLPLNKLKIDQAFVRDIGGDKNDRVIVETIISMAQHLDMEVIAEGVEEKEQLDYLREHGCHQYQGYYFGKPVPADEFFRCWIEENPQSAEQ